MAINKKEVTLSSGCQMPLIGFGTCFSYTEEAPDPMEVENAVKCALQCGYRHLDCAAVYQNEVAVGKGIKASGVPRSDIFITSKLWNTEHEREDVGPALDKTLEELGVDYVDLYLVHWPTAYVKLDPYTLFPEDEEGKDLTKDVPISSTWAAMEELVAAGKARSIGVSNFGQAILEELLTSAKIIPTVDQLQVNPYRQRKDQLEWFKAKNIHITAWGPLTVDWDSKRNVTNDAKLCEIAESIKITPTQLALSWAIQRGTSVVPRSSNEKRMRENFEIVELPQEVFDQVENLA